MRFNIVMAAGRWSFRDTSVPVHVHGDDDQYLIILSLAQLRFWNNVLMSYKTVNNIQLCILNDPLSLAKYMRERAWRNTETA